MVVSDLTCMPPGETKAVRSGFRQTFASTGSAAQEQPLRIEYVWALPSKIAFCGYFRCARTRNDRSLHVYHILLILRLIVIPVTTPFRS